jgi:hypothetical protein
MGPDCLAPLTGTDARALSAAVHILNLYAFCAEPTLLPAFGIIVRCMEPSTQKLAYHAIAFVMDWTDREPVWEKAGLPKVDPRRSFHEGGAS